MIFLSLSPLTWFLSFDNLLFSFQISFPFFLLLFLPDVPPFNLLLLIHHLQNHSHHSPSPLFRSILIPSFFRQRFKSGKDGDSHKWSVESWSSSSGEPKAERIFSPPEKRRNRHEWTVGRVEPHWTFRVKTIIWWHDKMKMMITGLLGLLWWWSSIKRMMILMIFIFITPPFPDLTPLSAVFLSITLSTLLILVVLLWWMDYAMDHG